MLTVPVTVTGCYTGGRLFTTLSYVHTCVRSMASHTGDRPHFSLMSMLPLLRPFTLRSYFYFRGAASDRHFAFFLR